IWPHNGDSSDLAHDNAFLGMIARSEATKNALNLFFVRDINNASGYSWRGSGIAFCGLDTLSLSQFQHVAAHEVGHAMCLHHFCAKPKEEDDQTFTGQLCVPGDETNIMYPHFPPGDVLNPTQIDQVRSGAFHFEEGKTQVFLDAPTVSNCGFKD